jgi:hypothetical protein
MPDNCKQALSQEIPESEGRQASANRLSRLMLGGARTTAARLKRPGHGEPPDQKQRSFTTGARIWRRSARLSGGLRLNSRADSSQQFHPRVALDSAQDALESDGVKELRAEISDHNGVEHALERDGEELAAEGLRFYLAPEIALSRCGETCEQEPY